MIEGTRPTSPSSSVDVKESAPANNPKSSHNNGFGASSIKSGTLVGLTYHWYSPITNFIKTKFYGVWDFLAKWISWFPRRPAYALASELGIIVVTEDCSNRDLLKEMEDQINAEVRKIVRDPQYQSDPKGYTRLYRQQHASNREIYRKEDGVLNTLEKLNSDPEWLQFIKSKTQIDIKDLDAMIDRILEKNAQFNNEQQKNAQRLVQTYSQPTTDSPQGDNDFGQEVASLKQAVQSMNELKSDAEKALADANEEKEIIADSGSLSFYASIHDHPSDEHDKAINEHTQISEEERSPAVTAFRTEMEEINKPFNEAAAKYKADLAQEHKEKAQGTKS